MTKFFNSGLLAIVFTSAFLQSSSAQVVPMEDVAGYKIARIVSADVCFAVADLQSAQNHDIVFSYYRAKSGQRWQVGGYLSAQDHPATSDTVTISIDGDLKLTRNVQFKDGDFIVPFESLVELENYERDIEIGAILTFGLEKDSFDIELVKFRAAIEATQVCVDEIE